MEYTILTTFDSLSIFQKQLIFYKLKQLGYDYEQYAIEINPWELSLFDKFVFNCKMNKIYLQDFRALTCKVIANKGDTHLTQDEFDKLAAYDKNIFFLSQTDEAQGYYPIPKFNTFLSLEFNIKFKKKFLRVEGKKDIITATDVSSYTYCPVSLSISNTFKLPIELMSAAVGTEMHDKEILLRFSKSTKSEEASLSVDLMKTESYLNETNEFFFQDISASVSLYSKKDTIDKPYFVNKIFYGQPDYIFQNTETEDIYVVEEKYVFEPKSFYQTIKSDNGEIHVNVSNDKQRRTFFYENHINQLLSYIYAIRDYKISYGYLVYWVYQNFTDDDIIKKKIIRCEVRKYIRNNNDEDKLRTLFNEIYQFKKNGKIDFSKNLNVNKCFNCVNFLLCGHKTRKFKDLTYPYNEKKYWDLKLVKYVKSDKVVKSTSELRKLGVYRMTRRNKQLPSQPDTYDNEYLNQPVDFFIVLNDFKLLSQVISNYTIINKILTLDVIFLSENSNEFRLEQEYYSTSWRLFNKNFSKTEFFIGKNIDKSILGSLMDITEIKQIGEFLNTDVLSDIKKVDFRHQINISFVELL